MKGSNVSYSSFGELKKAHTCRCSRSIERANGIGAGAEVVMSLYLRRGDIERGRRGGAVHRKVRCLTSSSWSLARIPVFSALHRKGGRDRCRHLGPSR